MPKIKNKHFAVSPARYSAEDDKILILPICDLGHAHSVLHNCISDEKSISNLIEKGVAFYYTIEEFDRSGTSRKLLSYERGVGILEGIKTTFMRRVHAFEQRVDHRQDIGKTPDGFTVYEDGTHLVVGTYLPKNYIDLCFLPFSVSCTTNPGRPEPVQIEPNSLLGRTDGDIQSINREELGLILGHEHLIDALSKTTAPILVGSAYFELVGKNAIVSANHFICKPLSRRPRNREAGSIIFNSKEKRFEGFDGDKWRPMKWADE